MFQLTRVIGNGSFGEIFLARHSVSGEEVAAKVEMVRNCATKSQLRREAKIYKVLYGSGTDEYNLCRSTT
jgi:serine/threonine protein kinase